MERALARWSSLAVILVLARVVWGEDITELTPGKATPLKVPAAEAELVVIDQYAMDVKRGGVTESYEGFLLAASERWVVLRCVDVQCEVVGVPYLMDIPRIGGFFSHVNVQSQMYDRWIPREAATVTSHAAVDKPAGLESKLGELKLKLGNEPPKGADCVVEVVAAGQLDHWQGKLTAVDEDELTLSDDGGTHSRQLAREFIFCVAVRQTGEEVAARLVPKERK